MFNVMTLTIRQCHSIAVHMLEDNSSDISPQWTTCLSSFIKHLWHHCTGVNRNIALCCWFKKSVLLVTLMHISRLESCPSKLVTSLNSFIGRETGGNWGQGVGAWKQWDGWSLSCYTDRDKPWRWHHLPVSLQRRIDWQNRPTFTKHSLHWE